MSTLVAAQAPLRPTSSAERLHALDAMRGVAILGVLFAYTVWSLGNPPEATWSALDGLVARGMDLFVDNKFLTMFACLFGMGVSQQWRRWEAAGHGAVPLHVRRMGFLLAAGLLHGIFLRNGDILAPYAILGFTLLAFRRRSMRFLAWSAVVLALLPYLVERMAAAIGIHWPHRPGPGAANYIVENVTWLWYWYLTNPFLSWPRVLALMLVGMMLGRGRVVERLSTCRELAVRTLVVAVVMAVVFRAAYEVLRARWAIADEDPAHSITLNLLYNANSWAVAASYGAALLLLTQSESVIAALWPVRALGRMAFTSYLSQAALVVPLCLAFGLFDHVTPSGGAAIGVGVMVLHLTFSTWWLRGHGMGPMERVWRTATYGRLH